MNLLPLQSTSKDHSPGNVLFKGLGTSVVPANQCESGVSVLPSLHSSDGSWLSRILLKSFCRFVVTFFILTYFLNRPCICVYNLLVKENRIQAADDSPKTALRSS